MLEVLLSSRTRSEILAILFDGAEKEYYLRQLEKLCHSTLSPIQKELKQLVELDLVKMRADGNRVYYSCNMHHPIYPDLVSIVEKTVGLSNLIRTKFKDSPIEFACTFGSMARGEEKGHSDIDLLVVGEISMRQLTKLLSGLEQKTGREINPHIFTRKEISERVRKKDSFIQSVLKNKKTMIIGDFDEFEGLFKQGLVKGGAN